jgi:plasmid stabilization system protein ParE
MRINYLPTAWLTLNKSIDFLRLQEVPENKITEIVEEIFQKAESLKQFPNSGQKETLLVNREKQYRRIVIRYFKIIYFVENESINQYSRHF